MADHLGTDLHQFLPQRGQRPVLDLLRQTKQPPAIPARFTEKPRPSLHRLVKLMGDGVGMVSVYIRLTLIQLATPDEMRGRVSAVSAVAINASNELGDFRAGVMAAGIGTVPAVLVGGAATLAVAALWARLFPEMRKVDRLDEVG